jgi:hypothetical protein
MNIRDLAEQIATLAVSRERSDCSVLHFHHSRRWVTTNEIVPPEPHSTPNQRNAWERIPRRLRIVLIIAILGAIILIVFLKRYLFGHNLHWSQVVVLR